MTYRYKFYPGHYYFSTYRVKNFEPLLTGDIAKSLIKAQINKCIPHILTDYFVYAILNNHAHVMSLVEDTSRWSKDLQQIFGGSSFAINKQLGRSGGLWGRPFTLIAFGEKSFSHIVAYILGNPIRHGVVKNFDELYEYPYCNFKEWCERYGRKGMEDWVLSVLKLKVDEEKEESFWIDFLEKNKVAPLSVTERERTG